MAIIEDKNTEMWKKLYRAWVAQGKPGVVIVASQEYRVLRPNDEEVKFVPSGGFDQNYGSRSKE